MYAPHPRLLDPLLHAGCVDVTIWRYMARWKFEPLLDKRALYFPRLDHLADALADPYEGSYPVPDYDLPPPDYSGVVPELRKILEVSLPTYLRAESESDRKRLFVNCWHMNNDESASMWHQYGREGVAIQSSIRRLQASFRDSPGYQYIAGVAYKDYVHDFIPVGPREAPFWPAICKRKSFSEEAELRVLMLEEQADNVRERRGDHGVFALCDLGILIEQIFVAPESGDAFRTEVARLVARHDLSLDIRLSTLEGRSFQDREGNADFDGR